MPRTNKRASTGKTRKAPLRPCTYELGYVRQDLYACRKCTEKANGVVSGFCRGCRETCHADHPEDVIELYTKRGFRCDCGNTRSKNTCLLLPHKEDLNVGNEACYSHNFQGRYCRCDREYDYRLAMAQCAMCEDWFHEECFKADPLRQYGSLVEVEYELTCKSCVTKLPVLAEYYELYNAWSKQRVRPTKRTNCVRPKSLGGSVRPGTIDYLWKPGFRVVLCRCNECLELYRAAKVQYLVDKTDFVAAISPDDDSLLNETDGAEIIKDVLEAEDPTERTGTRVKVKKASGQVVSDAARANVKLTQEEKVVIRKRIEQFLQSSIKSNGESLTSDALIAYLADLKADLLNSVSESTP